MIRIGCSGIPKARVVYFAAFDTTEVQQTFYQPPLLKTAAAWRETTPAHVHYVVKAWQLITHESTSPTYRKLKTPVSESNKKKYGSFKNTPQVKQAWKVTREFADELGAKIVLFQCPKSFKPSAENKTALEKFLKMTGPQSFRLAVEVRGEWTKEDIQPFVDQFKIIHAIDPYVQEPAKQDFVFYRLHGKGPSSNPFRYKYTPQDLAELESKLKISKNGYVFFNNVYMWDDALLFKKSCATKPSEKVPETYL